MSKTVVASCVALAALGLWAAFAPAGPGIDPMTSGSIAGTGNRIREYSINNIVSATKCVVTRGAVLTSRSRAFFAGDECDDVWPGLSSAHNWTENGDGTVVLSDSSGEAVLTVAASDGPALEAIDPPDAMLTVTAIK